MKTIAAIVLGFCSGFVVYMIAAMLFAPIKGTSETPGIILLGVFVIAWVMSAYAFRRNALTVSRVFTRGALVGAAEWLLVALAGMVMSGRLVADTSSGADSEAAAGGAALGGGLFALMAGAMAVGMAVVCLIVFAVAYFAGREMADRTGTPTRKCPECAEMVQAEARRCKHCGSILAPLVSRIA